MISRNFIENVVSFSFSSVFAVFASEHTTFRLSFPPCSDGIPTQKVLEAYNVEINRSSQMRVPYHGGRVTSFGLDLDSAYLLLFFFFFPPSSLVVISL